MIYIYISRKAAFRFLIPVIVIINTIIHLRYHADIFNILHVDIVSRLLMFKLISKYN